MSTIDNRVVQMNFDNSQFASGVSKTLSMLDRLKASLGLSGASQGLKDVNAAAQQFNSAPMEQGVGRIAGSFTSMQAIAFGALANIGARVSDMAMNMAKSFTIEPLTAGFQEYELKMGSIQTILANTARHGTTLETIEHELEVLNQYADQTIYNFGDMTRNIGLFTNAGIKVEDATAMIKGFSNAAAASGTNAEQAAHAAQQLSQGLSAGKITAQDWMSLTNAQMGNKNMQIGLIDIAKAMGSFSRVGGSAKEAMQNFKGSLEDGWLETDVMSTYLRIMAGDMSDAEIAAIGLSDASVAALRQQATMGLESATKVRTFTQLMGTLRESVGSGWAESFQILFGDFNEATDLFTGLSNSIGTFFQNVSKSRNALLTGWKEAKGRALLLQGLTDAFKALFAPMVAVGQAFRQIFPAMTVDRLVNMTKGFREFMAEIQPSSATLDRLQRTFAGLFAILHIGWTILKAVGHFLGRFLMSFGDSNMGVLRITASIGDFFVALDKAISAGKGLTSFFDMVYKKIMKVIDPIKDLGRRIGEMFEDLDVGPFGKSLGEIINGLLTFNDAGKKTSEVWDKVQRGLKGVADFFIQIATKVADFVEPVTSAISDALQDINFDDVNKALQTLSLGGIALFIKQLGGMFKGLELFRGAGGGIMHTIKEGLDNLTGTLSAMQANLKASMLLKIAAAIALLAVSVVLLASVDTEGLIRATSALTVMFIQLGAAMAVFQKIGTITSIAKLNLMGAALILLGIAILILAGAVKVLATMSWEELGKGMSGLIVLIGSLILLSKGMDRSRGAVLRSAAAMIIMGAALKVLVGVVRELGSMRLDELAKGIGGVAALLIALGLFSRLQKVSRGSLAQAASIVALAYAIGMLAESVKAFARMSWADLAKGFAGVSAGLIAIGLALRFTPNSASLILTALSIAKVAGALGLIAVAFKAYDNIGWETIAKGVVAMGSALGILTGALKLMPKVNIVQSVSLLLIASAIAVLSQSINQMGSMDITSLAKGVGALAVVLGVLVGALKLMQSSVGGAVAMLIIASALQVLLPVIQTLGAMPIPAIAIALGALAAVFVVLGVAALVLRPLTPTLIALGIAVGLLGAGMALAGAGVFLFATGLAALGAAGAVATAGMIAMVSGLLGLIPMAAQQIGLGIVALLKAIADSSEALVSAFVKIMTSLLNAIIKVAPKLGQTLLVLLRTGLKFLVKAFPELVDAGMKLIISLLKGVRDNIGRITGIVVDIVVNFIDALGKKLPDIIQAGIDFILAFMNGIGDAARNNGAAIADAAWNMATGIIDGIVEGLMSLGGKLIDAILGLLGDMWDSALDFLGISSPSKKFMQLGRYTAEGFIVGMRGKRDAVKKSVDDMFDFLNASIDESRSKVDSARNRIEELNRMNVENARKMAEAQKALANAQARGVNTEAEVRAIHSLQAARSRNNAAISEQNRLIAQYTKEYQKAYNARRALSSSLLDERKKLDTLGRTYDLVSAKLDAANGKLADAKKIRDDYSASIRDQYGDLPEIDAETKLADYVSDLEAKIIETQKFTTAIGELRKRGLNDTMYKELLAKGPAALPFINQVLEGGKAKVDQLNTLGSALNRDATTLGNNASMSLYQAGVNAAQGLVDGLKKQQKAIDLQMEKIANSLISVMKKQLGIKSPSRVFAELGKFSAQGLSRGLDDTAAMVGRSAQGVGQHAIDGMKKTIKGLGALVEADMDVNPTIAPVLDLSNVRREASNIGSLLQAKPLAVTTAYSGASDASAGLLKNQLAAIEAAAPVEGDVLTFNQYNQSPKALTPGEIYRQTKNQLSVAKGALDRRVK